MTTPECLGFGTYRKFLNYVLPQAQLAAYAREACKSSMVKCFHQIRLALLKIAERFRSEGRLPDAELIFFLTIDEMYRLARARDPALVQRCVSIRFS